MISELETSLIYINTQFQASQSYLERLFIQFSKQEEEEKEEEG